jgi:hypothetical protein
VLQDYVRSTVRVLGPVCWQGKTATITNNGPLPLPLYHWTADSGNGEKGSHRSGQGRKETGRAEGKGAGRGGWEWSRLPCTKPARYGIILCRTMCLCGRHRHPRRVHGGWCLEKRRTEPCHTYHFDGVSSVSFASSASAW